MKILFLLINSRISINTPIFVNNTSIGDFYGIKEEEKKVTN